MLYEKENLIQKAIETNSQNRGINNLIRLWSEKIRDNLEYFLDNQELVIKLDEIDQKISEIESKISSKKKENETKMQNQKEINMDIAYFKNRSYITMASIAAITGFLVQSATDYTWYNYRVVLIFWLVIAIGISSTSKEVSHD